MIAERPKALLVPLQELLPQSVREGKERGELTPVGAVFYNQGGKLVLMMEEAVGAKLHPVYLDTPEACSPKAIIEQGRVLDLHTFDEVLVGTSRVGEDVQVAMFSSIKRRPSVAVRFSFTNPADQKREQFTADEDEILRLFTNEKGGIAIFDGGGLPEEVALMFERRVGEKKVAFLFFIHPGEVEWGLDSPKGLGIFLRQLNEHFVKNAHLPFQDEAIAALCTHMREGDFQFASEVRAEIFRTVIIAHARMAEKTGSRRYTDFLEHCLPHFRQNLLRRLIRALHIRLPSPEREQAEDAIDRITLPHKQREADVLDELAGILIDEIGLPVMLERLRTERAKSLRESVEPDFGKSVRIIKVYLESVAKMVRYGNTLDELDDALLLVRELQTLPIATQFRSVVRVDAGVRGQSNWREGSIKEIAEGLISETIVRRDKMQEAPSATEEYASPQLIKSLHTQEARDLLVKVGEFYGEPSKTMGAYLGELYKMGMRAFKQEEFSDVLTLLKAARATKFCMTIVPFRLQESRGGVVEATSIAAHQHGSDVVSGIIIAVEERKDRIQASKLTPGS